MRELRPRGSEEQRVYSPSRPYHRTNAPLMPKCLNTGMKKVCLNCTQEKPVTQFYRNIQKGKVYWSQQCKTCRPDRQRRSIASREKQRDHERTARKDPAKRANFILSACKNFDKRHGFVCDLDLKFIQQTIAPGCSYCLDTIGQMTLDRIDNSMGHLKFNVVSCCFRCNYIRRNMPHAAWLVIVPAIKRAHQLGLFQEWMIRKTW